MRRNPANQSTRTPRAEGTNALEHYVRNYFELIDAIMPDLFAVVIMVLRFHDFRDNIFLYIPF